METDQSFPNQIHLPEVSRITVFTNKAGGLTIQGNTEQSPDSWLTVDSKERLRELIKALKSVGKSCTWEPEEEAK